MDHVKTALALALLGSALPLLAADPVPSAQAKDHVGETVTVCGKVADARYLDSGNHATFVNFDKPYPDHTFTIYIAGENRAKFGTPEKDWLSKDVCITGKIQDYRGKPEIVATEASQIKLPSK